MKLKEKNFRIPKLTVTTHSPWLTVNVVLSEAKVSDIISRPRGGKVVRDVGCVDAKARANEAARMIPTIQETR